MGFQSKYVKFKTTMEKIYKTVFMSHIYNSSLLNAYYNSFMSLIKYVILHIYAEEPLHYDQLFYTK